MPLDHPILFSQDEKMVQKPIRDPAIDRAAALLLAVMEANGSTVFASQLKTLGIPLSTGYRIANVLAHHGLLARTRKGHYGPGYRLAAAAGSLDKKVVLGEIARQPIRRLARKLRATVHLGIFEDDMVTYIVKESSKAELFTREGGQLEAYCSGVGKVLLAHLDQDAIERYLAAAPFIALTSRTVTSPDVLRRQLGSIRKRGFATDNEEVANNLVCVAVPVRAPTGEVVSAVSLSGSIHSLGRLEPPPELIACARAIEIRLGSSSDGTSTFHP